ncbi:hypothetical protein ACPCSF_00445 [Streptomyces griseoincarnatus]
MIKEAAILASLRMGRLLAMDSTRPVEQYDIVTLSVAAKALVEVPASKMPEIAAVTRHSLALIVTFDNSLSLHAKPMTLLSQWIVLTENRASQ